MAVMCIWKADGGFKMWLFVTPSRNALNNDSKTATKAAQKNVKIRSTALHFTKLPKPCSPQLTVRNHA